MTMWSGCLTALITPFAGGAIDHDALRALVTKQIDAGVDGLVPCGSTGESATLTHDEHADVIRTVVETTAGRVPVIAGTGSNATAEAVELTRRAEDAGADGALLISPYYNKPTQDGIYRHYAAVAEASSLPLVVYNIPGRTASNIAPETMARLATIPTVIGVKEASGDLEQIQELARITDDEFRLFSGDDALTLPIITAGGHGVISVTANVVPREFTLAVRQLLGGDVDGGRAALQHLAPLVRDLFLEVNPIPVKTAMHLMGACLEEFRLPLTPMTAENRTVLERRLTEFGLV